MIPNWTSKLALVSPETFCTEFELTVSKTNYLYRHLKVQSVARFFVLFEVRSQVASNGMA